MKPITKVEGLAARSESRRVHQVATTESDAIQSHRDERARLQIDGLLGFVAIEWARL
jgi:hypothetical protein